MSRHVAEHVWLGITPQLALPESKMRYGSEKVQPRHARARVRNARSSRTKRSIALTADVEAMLNVGIGRAGGLPGDADSASRKTSHTVSLCDTNPQKIPMPSSATLER